LVRIFWTLDIPVSFMTGYVDSAGKLVMDSRLVSRRYASRQLPLDLVVVATDWTEQVTKIQGSSVLKGWRFLRVARLLRLTKARDIIERSSEFFKSERLSLLSSIVRLLAVLVWLMHFLACCWYAVGYASFASGEDSWVTTVNREPVSARYLHSLHFAVALFHGEQIIFPENLFETGFISCVLYLIFVWNAWLVSTITTAMTHLEIISTRKTGMMSALERWLHDNNVSYELTLKVQRSAKKCLQQEERNVPEANIALLQMISDPLRLELHYEIHSAIIFLHPFFLCYNSINPGAIKNICHTSVSSLKVAAEDVVFSEMEQAAVPRILFVIDGALQYSKPSQGESLCEIAYGNWMGEALLWTEDWLHVGTARALTDCRLLAVEVKGVYDHVAYFGTNHARHFAQLFTTELNELPSEQLSDVGRYTAVLGSQMMKVFGTDWLFLRTAEQAKIDFESSNTTSGLKRLSQKVQATHSGNAISNAGRRISDTSRRISDTSSRIAGTMARRISGHGLSSPSADNSVHSFNRQEARPASGASAEELGLSQQSASSRPAPRHSEKLQVVPIDALSGGATDR